MLSFHKIFKIHFPALISLSLMATACDQQPPSASVSSEQTSQTPITTSQPLVWDLDQAILYDETNKVIDLLKNGADPNSSIDGSGTPEFYIATRFHRTGIVEILLTNGANVNCLARFINGSKMSPLDIADKMGFDDLVTLLKQHGGKTSDELNITNNQESNIMQKTGTVIFSKDSNGYDWQRADSQSRQQFCETIATAMSKEFNHSFTAGFYYNALDSFYNSSDANILNENIHQVIGLTTSAAIAGQ